MGGYTEPVLYYKRETGDTQGSAVYPPLPAVPLLLHTQRASSACSAATTRTAISAKIKPRFSIINRLRRPKEMALWGPRTAAVNSLSPRHTLA